MQFDRLVGSINVDIAVRISEHSGRGMRVQVDYNLIAICCTKKVEKDVAHC